MAPKSHLHKRCFVAKTLALATLCISTIDRNNPIGCRAAQGAKASKYKNVDFEGVFKLQHHVILATTNKSFICSSVSLFVCLSVCLSACPYVCLSQSFTQSMSTSICLSVHPPVRLSICLPVCPSVDLSVYPSARPFIHSSVNLSCLSIQTLGCTRQRWSVNISPLKKVKLHLN